MQGCLSKNPAKDLLIPGRTTAYVSPVKLNSDDLVDLIVQGDGGSGGSMIYVFFQEKNGDYTLKGTSFGYAVFVEAKKDAPASLVVQSQSGICRQHFSRIDFENDQYVSKAGFLWKCINEAEIKTQFAVEELTGTWSDTRLTAGYKGELNEVRTLLPEMKIGFVEVDTKFRLIMKD